MCSVGVPVYFAYHEPFFSSFRRFVEVAAEYIPTEQEFASQIMSYSRAAYYQEMHLYSKAKLHSKLTDIGDEMTAVEEVRKSLRVCGVSQMPFTTKFYRTGRTMKVFNSLNKAEFHR